MTVSTAQNRISYTGDGATTVFPFPYLFLSNTDIKVTLAGVPQMTGYTVSGAGNSAGGNVTFVTPPGNGASIVLYRDPDSLQNTALSPNDPFPSKSVESMVDKAMLGIQRLRDLIARTIILSDGDPSNPTLQIPVNRANTVLAFDASGNLIASTTDAANVAAAQAAANAAAASAAQINLPSIVGKALNFLRVRSDQTGYEHRTPTQVRADIGASTVGDAVFTAADARAARNALGIINHGQCKLVKSGANVVLQPYNGNRLMINGNQETIPSAGVSLAPTGLTPSTLYYMYAYMNSGTMTLEAATTTHATDATTGVEVKSGDATRTLVGMVRPITGPAFQDTAAQRFVRSWFNDTKQAGTNTFSANRSTASLTAVELNSEIRNEFLLFAGESVYASTSGTQFNSSTSSNYSGIGFDGTTPENGQSVLLCPASTGGMPVSVIASKTGLSEGYHYATFLGNVDANTGTWVGGATRGVVLSTLIR